MNTCPQSQHRAAVELTTLVLVTSAALHPSLACNPGTWQKS